METCFRCGRNEREVKLLDAISFGEVVKICEECLLIEDMPVIRKPTTQQLKESERSYTVKERLRRMAGLDKEKDEIKELAKKITDVTLDDLRPKTKEEEQKERQELAKEKNKPLNLIDNFHWHILLARKKKKLTRKELAELLGESETAIKMIENKEMPDDPEKLIKKIEQFFGIKLMKEDEEREEERIEKAIEKKQDVGEGVEVREEKKEEKVKENEEEKEPTRILKFDPKTIKKLTIADLRKLKEKLAKKEQDDVSNLVWQVGKEKEKSREDEWKQESEKSLIGNEIELE